MALLPAPTNSNLANNYQATTLGNTKSHTTDASSQCLAALSG